MIISKERPPRLKYTGTNEQILPVSTGFLNPIKPLRFLKIKEGVGYHSYQIEEEKKIEQ